MTNCVHETTEPVRVMNEGPDVACICVVCLEELPTSWGCDECEWRDGPRRLCENIAPLVLFKPCRRHAS